MTESLLEGVGRPRRMQRAGEGPNGDRWGRARAERTLNMPSMLHMFVTLDVSKLSGWLNTDADCRVARSAFDAEGCGSRGEKGVGRPRRMQRAGEGPKGDRWGDSCAEHT